MSLSSGLGTVSLKRKHSEPQTDRKRARASVGSEHDEDIGNASSFIAFSSLIQTVLFSAPTGRATRRTRPSAAAISQPVTSTRGSRPTNKPLEVLHSTINTLKGYSLFAEPVTDRLAEGYSKVVREPQDLKTIRANIRNGTISTTDEYERAIYLMFANAIMYNLPGSAAASDAKEVRYIFQVLCWASTHGGHIYYLR
jgi:hypothetical protein